MMNRRLFTLAMAAMVAGCGRDDSSAATATGAAASAPAGAPPLGVQLYTVRDLMAEDVAATLDLVASVGFEQVEFAGYYDHTPAEMRRLLDASGLAPVSAHVGRAVFAEDAARAIDHAAEMGHEFVVIPYLAEEERSLDDYRRHAADFNRWGEACAQASPQRLKSAAWRR